MRASHSRATRLGGRFFSEIRSPPSLFFPFCSRPHTRLHKLTHSRQERIQERRRVKQDGRRVGGEITSAAYFSSRRPPKTALCRKKKKERKRKRVSARPSAPSEAAFVRGNSRCRFQGRHHLRWQIARDGGWFLSVLDSQG